MAEMSGDRCGGGSKSSVDVRPKEGTIPKARSSENLKRTRSGSKPVTLISALQNKYSTSSMKSTHCQIFITSKAPGKTESGSFRVPEVLILDSCKITSAGRSEDLNRLCSQVTELDLTDNSITSWSEVWTLLDVIPGLRFLNLTSNPLTQLTERVAKQYPNLKNLALNFTNLNWKSIQHLLTAMPNLEELYLSGNAYEDFTLNIPAYPSLRLLQLTSNKLTDWRYVVKLDRIFPNLRNLTLARNKIEQCGNKDENGCIFNKLTLLNMNNTRICDWNELEKLACIKSLKDMRLTGIPLVEAFDELKRRQMLGVYFPHVCRLNGSSMTTEEQDTAERVYVRHFQELPDKPTRYAELVAKHGQLDPLAIVNMEPANSVAMTVVCGDKEALFDIPTKQTIGQLKKSLKKYVGSARFKLYHDDYCQGPTEIKSNNRFVWALNFRDGETLICDHIEPRSRGKQGSPPSSPDCLSASPGSPAGGLLRNGIENIPPSPSKEPPLKKR